MMPTNFELKRLKLKLDIVEKAENRVHKLTDSNVSRATGQHFKRQTDKHFGADLRKKAMHDAKENPLVRT